MKKLPRSSTRRVRATITIRGITYYQAYDKVEPKFPGAQSFVFAENNIGETVFAIPGGGRATLLELRKILEAA